MKTATFSMAVPETFNNWITAICAIVVMFATVNGLLYTFDTIQRGDYMLANSLLVILIYLAYLTYQIRELKRGRK